MYKKVSLKIAFDLDRKIQTACNYNNAKVEFIRGNILSVDNTNVSFIEPHKAIIDIKGIKLVLIYFDNDSLFLFDRTSPFTVCKLINLFKRIRKERL